MALAALGLFTLTALSALVGLVASAIPMPTPAWTLFGFEAVILITAILGIFYARSGCQVAPAIGLACLAGCVGAASYLGVLSVHNTLGNVSLTPFLLARLLLSAAIGGLALIAAMRGDRDSWATLIKGVVLGLPAAAAAAVFILPQGKRIIDAVANLGGLTSFIIGTVVFLVATASASAGVHLVIRSFETAGQGSDPGRRSAA